MDFRSEAADDEAKVRLIFETCDADGDGALSRAEYTAFLRACQPDYLDDPNGKLSDEGWATECANLGAADSAEGAVQLMQLAEGTGQLRLSWACFERLYTFFGRAIEPDYTACVPAEARAAAVAAAQQQQQQQQLEAGTPSTTADDGGGGNKLTKLAQLTATVARLEAAALSSWSPSASPSAAPSAATTATVLERGRTLRASLAELEALCPDMSRVYTRAGGGGGEVTYGERAAAQALQLHERYEGLCADLQARIEQGSEEFATAEAARSAELLEQARAARAAREAEAAQAAREEAAARAAAERRRAEEEAAAAEAEAARRAAEAETHARAEAVRRQRGQAPMGQGDQFRKGRWKSWPLGQDPSEPLSMDLAIQLQADEERMAVAVRGALASVQAGVQTPREQRRKALGVITMFIDNIVTQPRSRMYRKIRLRNERFAQDVLAVEGARACLEALGFEEEEWWGGMAGEGQPGEELVDGDGGAEAEESEAMEGERFLILNEVNLDHLSASRRLIEELRAIT